METKEAFRRWEKHIFVNKSRKNLRKELPTNVNSFLVTVTDSQRCEMMKSAAGPAARPMMKDARGGAAVSRLSCSNQAISQSINVNQLINQSINWSIDREVNPSISHIVNQPINQSELSC